MGMTGIVQSGNVTPGHLVAWTADGTVQDGGPSLGGTQTVVGRLLGANFNTTADQAIPLLTTIIKVRLQQIIVTNASLSLTTAAGGFYPQPSKGGSAIVAAGQVYSALTGVTSLVNPTLTAFASGTLFYLSGVNQNLTAGSVYFSLTTAQGVACTADIYLTGLVLG